jgi:hypothetical protein
MFVWGGSTLGSFALNSGGRYDPATDTWTPVTTSGAPTARMNHTAVWDGTRVIVWGGCGNGCGSFLNTGGLYDIASGTWSIVSTSNAPMPRTAHTAVWTGAQMVVWGGYSAGIVPLNSGGRYDPVTNHWTSTSTTGAPEARAYHTAVHFGSVERSVIWGGTNMNSGDFNNGAIYDATSDTWTPVATTNAPAPRYVHAAVVIGGRMIVWGGCTNTCLSYFNDGGVLDLGAGTWSPTTLNNAPTARCCMGYDASHLHLFVWGGQGFGPLTNTGGLYDPVADTWTPTTTTGAPVEREWTEAVWSGAQFIVWGGNGECDPNCNELNSGGRYDPDYAPTTPTPTPPPTTTATPTATATPTVTPTPPTYYLYLPLVVK